MQQVIDVAKTVRDLELKYAEVDVAGTKRLHRYAWWLCMWSRAHLFVVSRMQQHTHCHVALVHHDHHVMCAQ